MSSSLRPVDEPCSTDAGTTIILLCCHAPCLYFQVISLVILELLTILNLFILGIWLDPVVVSNGENVNV